MYKKVSGSFGSLFLILSIALVACKTTSGYIGPSQIVKSIDIVTLPDKRVYVVGDAFDPRGLVVEATYADRSVRTVPMQNLSFEGFDSSVPVEEQAVTIRHGGRTAEFTVDIRE